MANILLISDNEVLNSIYTLNLKIYTNSDVVAVSNFEEAFEVFSEEGKHYDLVISSCFLQDEDVGIIVCNEVAQFDQVPPLLFIGERGDIPDDQFYEKFDMDIRRIIKYVGEILDITAQDMVGITQPNFYPMPIRMFFSLKISPCDAYYLDPKNPAQEYIKIFKQDDNMWPKIKGYLDQDVTVLYIHKDDRFSFAKDVTHQLIDDFSEITSKTDNSEKLEKVNEGIEAVAEQIFSGEMTQEIVDLSNQCMETITDALKTAPDLKSILRDLNSNQSGYLYSHSIMAGYVATHIIDKVDWGSQAHKDRLQYVLFFHDMYLTSVYKAHPELMYEDSLIFDDRLNDTEKEIIVSHALEAAEVVSRFPRAPMGVDTIIRQHHGTSNGLGFADVYKDDISPLAKVMIVAEAFTEELLKKLHGGEKIVIPDIIVQIKEKFPKHTYVKIANHLESIKI
jgi:CheY-like chemotaxis protein